MSQTAHHKQRLPLSFKLLYALPVLAAGIPALAQAEAPASVSHTKHAAASKTAKKHVAGATASTAAPASVQAGAPTVITKTGSAKHTISQARGTAEEAGKPESVTVIGSLFKDPNLKSMSPITHISRQDMQRRGFANVTDALQSLSSNGAGTLSNAFSANGAFAGGASAPSLRGLSTDSTLVLMDGMRLSYYPLSDDGERNFVDTNWMPSSIMESVDTMEDAGSSLYGADAVAGVINYTTRKEIKGFEGNAEGGLAQGGFGGHQKLYATYGVGDLKRDGYNFYVNSEYQQDDAVYNRQLDYPYNTSNLSGIGGINGITNVSDGAGGIVNFGATPVALVRASNGSTSGTGAWQLLNPSAGCGQYGSVVTGKVAGAAGTSQACSQDSTKDYAQISPSLRRVSATAHLTVDVTPRSQLTSMFTYSQALSEYTGTPYAARARSQSRNADTYSTAIPVTLPDGSPNPNNILGVPEQVMYSFNDLIPKTQQFSENFRGAVRYNGTAASHWGSDWNYDINFTGMNTMLQQTITGAPTIAGIKNAIIDGTYNFVNPSENSQEVLNSIAPKNVMNARSQEYSGDMHVSKGLFKLPGGMANLAIGGNIRYEALNDPSANPYDRNNPDAQYVGYINPFNAQGSRWVEAGYWELALPFHKMVQADISGRYDHYAQGSGFGRYSPKAGLSFTPVRQFTLRGTFSRGFRVPSFAETNGMNVAYTTYNVTNQNFINQHLNANGTPNSYAQAYSLGQNTAGNPNLKPEISTNFTGSAIIRPTEWMNFTFGYYYVKKSNYIAPNPLGATAIANAWLNGGNAALPAGTSVTPDQIDTQNPNGQVRPYMVNLQYLNTRSLVTDGVDMKINANTRLPGIFRDIRLISTGQATYVRSFNLTMPDGRVQHWAGTLAPYNAVSASGTPRWRANWSNTFIWRNLAVTPTVYYTSGYKNVAEDTNGPGTRSCGDSANLLAGSAYAPTNQCHIRNWWDVDLNVTYRINDRWRVYTTVYNLLGFRAPADYGTYGSYLYNSSWAQKGAIMRSFQFGVNVTL
ncbi:TonB-dependent receptor [Acetobacter indonesiensis NRIC 0313]|uniref:Outer membrane siderophore receptor n=1 Tax=Acetobacter indonesiensis TaxID=104101 RepID=A0A6N3T8Y8_9PROT|nr:TonB-dependent receptor [Acetobacter indonesiensis]GAN64413.1 outer membrane siderophore receptor [Acetobacter indonesiensis]GBQ60914.1 TonB-dependent receptor [Acetobacter indonesiensis NRIC 0313]GEN04574.1 TonB-dependent receptor [Acetobacter indonesiensis]